MARERARPIRADEQPLTVALSVGDECRLAPRPDYPSPRWKRISELTPHFVVFDGEDRAPASRRVLEDGILSARIEHRPGPERTREAGHESR
jgi:hypothetical protein